MKTNRNYATICLAASCFALVMAANASLGEQPGVVRLTSTGQDGDAIPVPVASIEGNSAESSGEPSLTPVPDPAGSVQMYPQPTEYAPYFNSYGAMDGSPIVSRQAFQANPLFGPQLMFETNLDDGLGYEEAFHRLNARIPHHVIPNTSILTTDLSASITANGDALYNLGEVWRNYDSGRNRIFGWNIFADIDQSSSNQDSWYRLGAGVESLGKYIDFRANGYFILGDESVLLNSNLIGNLMLSGNNAFRIRNEARENAYSGADFEVGGPLPIFGRRGFNMYAGAYYLGSEYGKDALGFQARWEALITESATVNVQYTNDETFGTNSWVSIAYSIPNYTDRKFMRPKRVRDRLLDPVYRSSRIHTHLDEVNFPEAVVNSKSGLAWTLSYVDPNSTDAGTGTFEDPYNTLQAASNANNAGIDIIRVVPNVDGTNTNLTVAGGLDLFDSQTLLSAAKDFTLFTENNQDFVIAATSTGNGPLISDPNMVAGGSVVRVANWNTIVGMQIDASNSAGTVFGTGISNPLPIEDINIVMNTFQNYETAIDLQDVSGDIVVDENTMTGLAGASQNGLLLTTAPNSTTNLLIRNNNANDNSVVGISVTAQTGSTINADDPNGVKGTVTGILNNTVTNGGTGIEITAQTGATINAVAEGNTATGNTFNGFVARADGATFNLSSMTANDFSSNLENGAFLHYLNGGTFNSVSEDLNSDGTLDAGEDLNGNGRLDQGIVANIMNDNTIAGLCIFGEGNSAGAFDIGGPVVDLGNTFLGNAGGGVLTDLQGSATAQIDAMFNQITGGGNSGPAALTIVLDFIDPGQTPVTDIFGVTMNAFDVTNYGFASTDFDTVTNAVLQTVESHFHSIPTVSQNSASPIPDGMELDIDFVIGDNGVAPSNGATEYYVMNIGDAGGPIGGIANAIGAVRDANGVGPNPDLFGNPIVNGDDVASLYVDSLATLQPFNPPNAFDPDFIPQPIDQAPTHAAVALTSGNLTFTRRAISLVTSHEIGHTLSLRHVDDAGAVTPTGGHPIMGTPAPPFLLPVQTIIEPSEFAISANHLSEGPGDPAFVQNSIQQLVNAVGLRTAGGPTNNGISVTATGSARLLASTFNNNTISGAQQHGINIEMNDNAVAESVTIQSNTISSGNGHGIELVANGAGAFIDADSTIGGSGTNTLRGLTFAQSNTITNNAGDGFRALAQNGGTIHGNLINNTITDNGGNGAALLIENGGFVDFGTTASNRIISGNTITGNVGAGIRTVSNVSSSSVGQMDVVIQGNTISGNTGGGIRSGLNGPNNTPPALPAVVENNVLNLSVGGSLTTQTNTLDGNADVGIGIDVTGNGLANVDIRNITISGTTDGIDPLTSGEGIFLRRADSSLLTALIEDVTSTNNAGNGMLIETQGNDKNDPNQPMSGTANSVTWNNSIFDNNGINGVAIRTRGDSMLIADGQGNFVRDNAEQGIDIETTENSNFGDATVGLPPGQRVVFDGITATGNGIDGLWATADEGSQLLLEVTSTRVASTSGAHAALNTNGDSSYSNNGSDGIHVDSFGNALVDVRITSEAPVTTTSGRTRIQDNGTVAGGHGIFVAAAQNGSGTVNVTNTVISGTIAGASEDTNGNGILDAGEDTNNNDDIDVSAGDGIAYFASGTSDLTLIVGSVGAGNIIQSNQDDGIALTATGSGLNVSRPIVTIEANTIGGESSGIPAGNGGDGVSMNIFGGTAVGIAPANVDFSIPPADGDGLSFQGGVVETGPLMQLTLNDNLISQNNRKGVNLLLTGAAGVRDRETGVAGPIIFDPVRINMTNNNIISNGEEGVFLRADSDMNQSRIAYLQNFPDPPFTGNDRTQTPGFYDPTQPEFTFINGNSFSGTTAFSPLAPDGSTLNPIAAYLNLRTVQNTLFTFTDNVVQNNGTNTVTGEGLYISVGTGSWVAGDVQRNVFGGNLEEDFRTDSFLSAGNTFDSLDTTGDGNFDVIYLDDSAQLDLRFVQNSGNQILVTDDGAEYTNADTLKAIRLGTIGVLDRDAAFFQVDDGSNLDNPNNTFINFGITQDIDATFSTGGYNLRGSADPQFPNPGFAPFLP